MKATNIILSGTQNLTQVPHLTFTFHFKFYHLNNENIKFSSGNIYLSPLLACLKTTLKYHLRKHEPTTSLPSNARAPIAF